MATRQRAAAARETPRGIEMTVTRPRETVATGETGETVYFCRPKSAKIQAVAQDFWRAPANEAGLDRESVSFRDTARRIFRRAPPPAAMDRTP